MGGFVAFFTAWGIGANDCANSFATSVGAKVITLKQALIIAAIFEFMGAFLMGSHVTDTVRKKIVDPLLFENEPNVLMFGMFCSCLATGIWLTIATFFKYPVSTTHSTIGAICGFALASKGITSVNGNKILEIVASWFISPMLSGLFALLLFMGIKLYALRKDDAVNKIFNLLPFLAFLTMSINSFFILYKGTPALGLKNTPLFVGILISSSVGGGSMILVYLFVVPYLKRKVSNITIIDEEDNIELREICMGEEKLYNNSLNTKENIKYLENTLIILKSEDQRQHISNLQKNAEIFDKKAEHLCSNLQITTACFSAFAHGANDVANAIAPFATIISIYNTNNVYGKAPVPIWILAIGGGGIVLGLGTWGYKIIERMGTQLTKVTPSRGFTMELSMSFAVVMASRIGLPVSTTHCQVGAIVGCGLADGQKNVNWNYFYKILFSWFITLPVAALISAGLFSLGHYSP